VLDISAARRTLCECLVLGISCARFKRGSWNNKSIGRTWRALANKKATPARYLEVGNTHLSNFDSRIECSGWDADHVRGSQSYFFTK